MPVRTLIADHGELSIIGLRAILSGVDRVELVGVARDEIELHALMVRHRPDVVLVDHMAEGFTARSIREGLKRSKRSRFVSITPDPSTAALMSAIRAGVTSYIKKDCGVEEIIDAVLHTADGCKFFCGKIVEHLQRSGFDVERFKREPMSCAPVTLSARENEIVQLIAEGLSYTRIAEQLNLSAHTVTTHRRNVMHKLGVNSTAAVVMYAVKNGLVSPNRYLFEGRGDV